MENEVTKQKISAFIKDHNNGYDLVDYFPEYIIGSDTDSVIIDLSSLFDKKSSTDDIVNFANELANKCNNSFDKYLFDVFNIPKSNFNIVKTNRELISDGALFLAKKKYIMHIIDKEGKREDYYKEMGVEIKKTDTPKITQNFLKELVLLILKHEDYKNIKSFIDSFKTKYYNSDILTIGTPKTVRTLHKYESKLSVDSDNKYKGFPQHVKASLIYNNLCSKSDQKIYSGSKVKIVYIDHYEYDAIAFPADIKTIPKFLSDFVVDYDTMWEGIEKKIEIYLSPIAMDKTSRQKKLVNSLIKF